jgi:hypothetical protein
MKRLVGVGAIALAVMIVAVPAGASTQVVDATLTGALSMTTEPSATVSGWSLAATGANTISGGSMAINANQPYTVTVTADKTHMTEYVTSTSSYVSSSPKTLTTAMTVSASRTSGTAVVAGVGAAAVVGTSTTLATGTGLGTDQYSVTLSQPTLITDQALTSGRTYHIELTYTLQSTL